ncbi:metabolite traffic protein EboE [Ammonicoccus fulvus]|uniref:Metabolite traffic protein EboE n=1 Tax=Ammonicoccus fulvus TaxID=3138240 RepID=A0ABZ3FQ03_9ACTN
MTVVGAHAADRVLSYCTNVHPAEDLEGLLDQLDTFSGPIRQRLGWDTLGVGLWLPAPVAEELATSPAALARLGERLDANRLVVRTLNAFPYRGFHDDVVKKAVYRPAWGDPERSRYTLHCAQALAGLLPEGGQGSLSTVPLGWREGWTNEHDAAATAELAGVTRELAALHERTGRRVRLAIEPEPGCVLDQVSDLVGWLGPRVASRELDAAWLGVCLDTCHQAISFADPAADVAALREAGLSVVKIQASAAPEVPDPRDPEQRARISRFVEPRYLHQTRELGPGGQVTRVDDLDLALSGLPGAGPWRVHFHIPVHAEPAAPLRSTRDSIGAVLRALARHQDVGEADIEVETYTWAVLPPETAGVDLITGIAGELQWLAETVSTAWEDER